MNRAQITLRIRGITPLILHNWQGCLLFRSEKYRLKYKANEKERISKMKGHMFRAKETHSNGKLLRTEQLQLKERAA